MAKRIHHFLNALYNTSIHWKCQVKTVIQMKEAKIQTVEDTCTTDEVQRPKRAALKRAQQAISSSIKELDS